MDFRYKLVGFDENYKKFLKAMDIPFWTIPFILAGSETVTINVTNEGHWKMVSQVSKWYTISPLVSGNRLVVSLGIVTRSVEFELGEEHEEKWGMNGGVMTNTCNLESSTVLKCDSVEKQKGWKMLTYLR